MIALDATISADLLQNVARKYHYQESDLAELQRAAGLLEPRLRGKSGFWQEAVPDAETASCFWIKRDRGVRGEAGADSRGETRTGSCGEAGADSRGEAGAAAPSPCVRVVLTLGDGPDALQEELLREGKLTECYMIEAIASELLLELYGSYNRWVAAHTDFWVAGYHFYGGEEGYPLEGMRKALADLGVSAVSCNDSFCLQPKKSVVFAAQLTREAGAACEGICSGCSRLDCPGRAGKEKAQ